MVPVLAGGDSDDRDAHSGLEGLLSGYCKFVESHKTISFLDGENWFQIKPAKRYEHLTGSRSVE